jgi:hypothetical protein
MMIRITQGKGGRDREVPFEPQATGDVARLLSLDAAHYLSVSGRRERSLRRRPHQPQYGLLRLPASRPKGRHHQTPLSSQPAAGFGILHHLSEFLHSKDNRRWPGTISGSLRPQWTAST